MSIEENKALVRGMFDAINAQNLASLDALMAPEFVLHMHARQTRGWTVNRRVITDEFAAFPDLRVTVEDILAEGSKVCVRLTERATHAGTYRGVAPTGRQVSYTVVAIWRIDGGKIAEGWIVYDQREFLAQLGLIEHAGVPADVP